MISPGVKASRARVDCVNVKTVLSLEIEDRYWVVVSGRTCVVSGITGRRLVADEVTRGR
jgi:hypothetical protein